jgi:hypothetical protein
MKVALIVGHTSTSKGARATNGVYEWDYNSHIAEEVKKVLPDVEVVLRLHCGGSYSAQCLTTATRCKELGITHAIALHFNSNEKIMAKGCEALTVSAWDLADKISSALVHDFGIKNRGVKLLKETDRGYYELRALNDYGIKEAVILEPFFGSYSDTTEKIIEDETFLTPEGQRKYIDSLCDFIRGLNGTDK